MFYNALKLVHLLSVILWVGGMLFAHCFLRPAAAELDPPTRLRLMHGVLGRFFTAVLIAIVVILVSGLWMIGQEAKMAVQSGGKFFMPLTWTVMATAGIVMMAIFGHIRFVLFKRLGNAVATGNWPAGGLAMAAMRRWVFANLVIGVAIVVIVFLG